MSQSEIPTREVAQRVYASELQESTYSFKESDDDRAPVYTLLPSGEKANRVFVVGTLTEVEDIGNDEEYLRGRVVGPTGTFYVYTGQYQPEATATLRTLEPPAYVAVVGKPRHYETDDGETLISIRPESINVVDTDTRDRWVAETAERTIERIEHFDEASDEYNNMAREQYGEDLSSVKDSVIKALLSLEESDPNADTDSDTSEDADADHSAEAETEAEPDAAESTGVSTDAGSEATSETEV